MSEEWLRGLAARHNLAVEKRVTTGNDKAGFARFEFTHPAGELEAAWEELKLKCIETCVPHSFREFRRSDNPPHEWYFAIDSVYFD